MSPFKVNSEKLTPEIFLEYCCWKSQSGVLLVEIILMFNLLVSLWG